MNLEVVRPEIIKKVIIWDNDGTILGSQDPNDTSEAGYTVLPNVERLMREPGTLNIICSGGTTVDGEKKDFDPEKIIKKFIYLMEKLPISAGVFSPAHGGTQCYVVIKQESHGSTDSVIKKAHEEERYSYLIGKFKKPYIGMFIVIKDLLLEEFNYDIDKQGATMIGNSWYDREFAQNAGINFIDAQAIHSSAYSAI